MLTAWFAFVKGKSEKTLLDILNIWLCFNFNFNFLATFSCFLALLMQWVNLHNQRNGSITRLSLQSQFYRYVTNRMGFYFWQTTLTAAFSTPYWLSCCWWSHYYLQTKLLLLFYWYKGKGFEVEMEAPLCVPLPPTSHFLSHFLFYCLVTHILLIPAVRFPALSSVSHLFLIISA